MRKVTYKGPKEVEYIETTDDRGVSTVTAAINGGPSVEVTNEVADSLDPEQWSIRGDKKGDKA